MAKKKKISTLDVNGMRIEDIMRMSAEDINKMSRKDLSKITSRLASAANKRIKRMQSSNESSPALAGVLSSGGKISVKGKNQGQLKAEFIRARQFLQGKTSGLRKAKEFKKNLFKKLGVKKLSDEQIGQLERIMDKIKELDPNIAYVGGKYTTNIEENSDYESVKSIVASGLDEGMDPEVLLDKAMERVNQLNEERNNMEPSFVWGEFETDEDIPFR